jgi:hypothetical protein
MSGVKSNSARRSDVSAADSGVWTPAGVRLLTLLTKAVICVLENFRGYFRQEIFWLSHCSQVTRASEVVFEVVTLGKTISIIDQSIMEDTNSAPNGNDIAVMPLTSRRPNRLERKFACSSSPPARSYFQNLRSYCHWHRIDTVRIRGRRDGR